jgi:hypothetical protein
VKMNGRSGFPAARRVVRMFFSGAGRSTVVHRVRVVPVDAEIARRRFHAREALHHLGR